VTEVVCGSSADGRLFARDVIAAVDGASLDDAGHTLDGTHFTHLVARRQVGDTIVVAAIRDGRAIDVDIRLAPYVALVPRGEVPARYIIVGGLVFTPLTFGFLGQSLARAHWRMRNLWYERPSRRRKEVVVFASALEHPVNAPYRHMWNVVLERVNGRDVAELRDVADALAHPVRGFHVLEIGNVGERVETPDYRCDWGNLVVLPAAEADAATAELLARHGIDSDRYFGA
jgi:hypothetical protein